MQMSIVIATTLGVYVDRRVTIGQLTFDDTKIRTLDSDRRIWYAFAGDADNAVAITDHFYRNALDATSALQIDDFDTRNTEGIIVNNGRPFSVFYNSRQKKTVIAILQIPQTTEETVLRWFGAGGQFFQAYLKEHANIQRALELTARHANHCGGSIDFRPYTNV
jgi:hypothetical protein